MEGEATRRRVTTMAGHFAAVPDDVRLCHCVIPLNCSASLNSAAVPRGDNRMCFARQGSASQARFMRQAPLTSIHQNCSASLNYAAVPRGDNRMCFARQGSASQARFMRQAPLTSIHQGSKNSCNALAVPSFSRPCMAEQGMLPSAGSVRAVAHGCDLTAPDPLPKFARPKDRVSREGQADSRRKMLPPRVVQGTGWSPKMDVVESGMNYLLTVEIPGVRSKDIRVENHVRFIAPSDNRDWPGNSLRVLGIRSAQATYRVSSFPDESILSFHKTEITRGPYEVSWPLPMNANRDRVSAEVADGFLQISIPKL